MNYGISLLETNTDAALNEPRVLPKLIALGAQTLVQEVASIHDRLYTAGKHPPTG